MESSRYRRPAYPITIEIIYDKDAGEYLTALVTRDETENAVSENGRRINAVTPMIKPTQIAVRR